MGNGYKRASKKQLAFIAVLYTELGETNPTLYRKYSLDEATKLISRLKRKIARRQAEARQTRLL